MAQRTTHDHADVVIVGSGPGGVIPATVLARKGIKVVCLEQGSWFPPDERPHFGRDWEWRRATDWSIAVNVRAHPHDYPVDSTDETTLMWNGVGGSTGIYTATWPRYRPSDFRKGTEHGLAPDWPISYEDLAPYFEMADEACGVRLAGRSGDAVSRPVPDPAGPRGAMGEVVARGFDKLGWHWWPMPCAILAEGYDGRLACNNCGACQSGCPRGSLNDMAVTHWPKALAAGVELRTDGGSSASRPIPRVAPRAWFTSSAIRACIISRRRMSSSSPPTASARRACCCSRRARRTRKGSPTAPIRWAAI